MRPGLRRQRGGVLVLAAASLGLALACLMVLDVAHVFTVQRDLQKVADLAALSGARLPGNCAGMQAQASASAAANEHDVTDASRSLQAECGSWTPEGGFVADASATALRVTAVRQLPYFFMIGAGRRLEAQAIARNNAYDVFALGSGLANLHDGALNALLSALLGTKVDLDLVSYQGLANSHLRLLDLVKSDRLDVGTLQELLTTEVKLADLTLAMADVLDRTQPVSADVLELLALKIPSALRLRLGDLLNVALPDPEAAANASIQVLQLLLTTAQVANGDNLLDLGLSVPANPLANVGLKLRIIEPPQIAIGREGTTARSAQIRLMIEIGVLDRALPGGFDVASVRLPLAVEAAPAQATLRRMECGLREEDCAVEFDVQSGLVRACVGDGADGRPGCTHTAYLVKTQIPLVLRVGVKIKAMADASDPALHHVRFGAGGFAGSSVTDSHWSGSAGTGASVGALLVSLVEELQLDTEITVLGLPLGSLLGGLLNPLLGAVLGLLGDIVSVVLTPLLTTLVDPLLGVLGVQTGIADLHQMELNCGAVELVR